MFELNKVFDLFNELYRTDYTRKSSFLMKPYYNRFNPFKYDNMLQMCIGQEIPSTITSDTSFLIRLFTIFWARHLGNR